jgi:hypothetical protein
MLTHGKVIHPHINLQKCITAVHNVSPSCAIRSAEISTHQSSKLIKWTGSLISKVDQGHLLRIGNPFEM